MTAEQKLIEDIMNEFQLAAATDRKRFNQMRRDFQKENRKRGSTLVEVHSSETNPIRALGSRFFFVQVYRDNGFIRLSINRSELDNDGNWRADITWDELMRCKIEAGYGDKWAVEVYPPTEAVVNVANMRHLFLLDEAPEFAWKKETIAPHKE